MSLCTIARYRYAKWTYNVHIYIYIYIYIKHWNLETRKTRLLSSGTKLFITFEFKGSSTSGERYTFFLFWLFHLPPTHLVWHLTQRPLAWLQRVSESQPSSPETGLNSNDFFKIPKSSARFRCVTSFALASPVSHLDNCDISEWHVRSAHAREHLC